MIRFCPARFRAAIGFSVVFLAASALPAQSIIFLVRHAEKAAAAPGEKDPDLSPGGRARAEALAEDLRDAGIKVIYATEWKRTQETAAPLAHRLGLNIIIVPAADTASLASKLQTTQGNALVVGHGDSLPVLLHALGVTTAVTIPDSEYDNLFIVVPGDPPRLLRLHYRASGG